MIDFHFAAFAYFVATSSCLPFIFVAAMPLFDDSLLPLISSLFSLFAGYAPLSRFAILMLAIFHCFACCIGALC